ncbi:MAG: GGDEF domain-containing protein [Mesorhizobium sp.]
MLAGGILVLGLLIVGDRRYYDLKREVARRSEAEREVHLLAYQGPLTGLPNRRLFEEALRMAVASPPKAGAVHAVFLLDLNGFKQVNDSYGHATGDAGLVVAAPKLDKVKIDRRFVTNMEGEAATKVIRALAGLGHGLGLAVMHGGHFGNAQGFVPDPIRRG